MIHRSIVDGTASGEKATNSRGRGRGTVGRRQDQRPAVEGLSLTLRSELCKKK